MALTQKKIEDLEDKDFHTLYDNHSERWKKMARTAHKHAKDNITDGNDPRPDDVAEDSDCALIAVRINGFRSAPSSA
jgi:hypothetical protein